MVDVLNFFIEFPDNLALWFSVLSWGLWGQCFSLKGELEAEPRGCKVVVVMVEYVFPGCSPFRVIWTVFVRIKGVSIGVFNDETMCLRFLVLIPGGG